MVEERKWTEEQLAAIKTRDRTLLVSAAAGSGKTATLTERIIRSLLDKENPENINEILVVTFTKAAATELRDRISKALRDAIKKNPESERLRRQLALLPSAKIQTIDSFCIDILRKNCDRVGISPSFRILDSAEARLLSVSTMERLIATVYEGLLPDVATAEEFETLTDSLTSSKRMNDLAEIFINIYEKLRSKEGGVESLLDLISDYDMKSGRTPSDTRPIRYAISRVLDMAKHYKPLFEKTLSEIAPAHPKSTSYIEMCMADISFLEAILASDGYEEMLKTLYSDMQAKKATRSTKYATEAMNFSVDLRDALDADVEYFKENFFFLSLAELISLCEKLYSQLSVFYRFLSRFDFDFMEEKKRIAVCEFSDVERYTYACLYDRAPTEIALAERERYSSIYIDEYQDVNEVQSRIFKAISKERNCFMVGDIKQSIYGFRGAKPEIFADMKKKFSDFGIDENACESVFFMSKNFRSDEPVINFVNEVFDELFFLTKDSIGYRKDDRLQPGKKTCASVKYPEIHILPKIQRRADPEGEPSFVAEKIKNILEKGKNPEGERYKPSDFTVLLRSDAGRSSDFALALEKRGIRSIAPASKSFFLSEEILLVFCLLNSIDNPSKDIYLAGLMCSPLFEFSADELTRIRRQSKSGTLYEALVEYCEKKPEYKRGADFLSDLNKYRCISDGLAVDEIISRLYRETGIVAVASASGKRNLTLFYEYARSFEASSFKGLYNFLRYMNDVINSGVSIEEKKETSDSQAVKITTVHGSKGLEYPIVFLADAGSKSMSKTDNNRLLYADGFSISMALRSDSGLMLVKNPINKIISDYNSRRGFEEELRVLYVALTRAREGLFVVATSPKTNMSELKEDIDFIKKTLSPYSVYSLPSYLISILATASTTAKIVWHEDINDTAFCRGKYATTPDEEPQLSKDAIDFGLEIAKIKERFDFRYKDELLTRLPEKMAVSYLYPTVLDGNESAPLYEILNTSEGKEFEIKSKGKKLPDFMSKTDADESAKRGIATHLFMQFFDVCNLKQNGAEDELSRLVEKKYLSCTDAELVRVDEIKLFEKSALLPEMLKAKNLYRELRFNLKFPANKFTKDEDKRDAYAEKTILVQGVIDCIIERQNGELLLIDYKTDRLTDAELKNRALAAEKLTRSHASQLSYYKLAVEKMFKRPPQMVAIYSLPLGDTVEIKLN